MTAVDRPRGTTAVGLFAVLLALTLAVAASGPWTFRYVGAGTSLWSASATTAIGAAVALLGAVVVAAGQVSPRLARRATRISALGCVVVALGVVAVVVGLRAPYGVQSYAPVTVAIAGYRSGPNQTPGGTAMFGPLLVFVAAVGLVVVTLTGGLLRIRRSAVDTSGATRPVVTVAALGAVLLAVGATALPWSVGDELTGRSLWRSSSSLAAAVAVLLVAALGAALLIRRPRPAPTVAVVVAVLAGLGGAVVLAWRLRLLSPWAQGVVSYSFLTYDQFRPPSAAALAVARALVYSGSALVLVAAVATVAVSALRGADTPPAGT